MIIALEGFFCTFRCLVFFFRQVQNYLVLS